MNTDRTVHLKPELFLNQFLNKNWLIIMAFLSIHLPLFFYLVHLIRQPNDPIKLESIIICLLGTFLGTLLLLLERYQLNQHILFATKVLNSYFQEGEFLELSQPNRGTIGQLFQTINHGIHHYENKLLDLKIECSKPQSQEIYNYIFQKEIAEDRLRQCLSIATRYNLPLCIAMIKIDKLQFNGLKELISPEPQILDLSQQLTDILRGSDWAAHWRNNEFLLAIFSEVEGTKIALERILERLNYCENLASDSHHAIPEGGGYAITPFTIGFTKVQRNEHYLACVDRANQALQKAQAINQSCVYL